MYRYFISFSYTSGFGNTVINFGYPISDIDDIRLAQSIIEDENENLSQVIIISFQRLEQTFIRQTTR